MSGHRSVVTRAFGVCRAMLASMIAVAMMAYVSDSALGWQEPLEESATGIRVIHGLTAAGPLDVYIDGAIALIGIEFGEVSAELTVASGERQLAVTSSGTRPENALVAGTVALRGGVRVFAPLIGSVDEPSVGLFTIDERPLEEGRGRFRVISGIRDVDGVVATYSGGEALTPTLGFGDASEYAVLDTGTYDLDVVDAATGALLLSLPATQLGEGASTDIVLIGQVADGSLTALVVPTAVETTRPVGLLAQVVAGTCSEPDAPVTDLGLVRTGQGAEVGVAVDTEVGQGYGLAPVSFETLVAEPHSVAISENRGSDIRLVACGAIGGRLTETGALVIPLQEADSDGARGVAVLAPGLEDPESTGVSIFLVAPDGTGSGLPGGAREAANDQ